MNYVELYYDWLRNSRYWFNSCEIDDEYLYKSYISLTKENDWKCYNLKDKSIEYWIGVIIFNDQITRHINRYLNNPKYNFEYNPENIIAISYQLLRTYQPHNKYFSENELLFILLPLRHSFNYENIHYSVECAFNYLDSQNESTVMKKFLRAAFQRMKHENNHHLIKDLSCNFKNKSYDHVLDRDVYKYDYKNINIDFEKYKNKNIIISLSGGVDSMVCSYLFKDIQNLSFVHINYMNRTETIDEEEFVIHWSNLLNKKCFVRRIDEIKRDKCMKYGLREVYEEYTKQVRFSTYKYVAGKFNNGLDSVVILGHNKDDAFENILGNIKSKSRYDNLEGFDFESTILDVVITRPLKAILKKDIFAFAIRHGIPFLKNTTPEWSWRSISRYHIEPILNKYNLVDGLFDISNVLKNNNAIIDSIINQQILEIKNNKDDKLECQHSHPIVTNNVYASRFFNKYYNLGNISIKSIDNYLCKLESMKSIKSIDNQKVILNKIINIRLKVNHDTITIYL